MTKHTALIERDSAGRTFMLNPAINFLIFVALVCTTCASGAAQTYVATDGPATPWGGYTLAENAPYPTGASAPYARADAPHVTHTESLAAEAYPAPASVHYDPAVRLAQAPLLGGESPLLPGEEASNNPASLLPPGTRSGVFQKFKFTATYLPQFENDGLGITDLRSSLVFGLPFFTRETPLVIEPEYRVHLLDRPPMPDLPARLHDTTVEFRHFRRIGQQWIFDGAVKFGMYADDHSFDASDAFRVSGRALGVYEASDVWKWIFGVVYLNRAGASVLPAAGLAYHTDTVKYELVFPRPRAAWLLPGSIIDCDEKWLYVMGEFGGGVWAIQRPATGTPDTLTTRDYRIVFGYERKVFGGLSCNFEFGYVFGRDLEFDSGTPPEVSLDDTLMIRAGFSY